MQARGSLLITLIAFTASTSPAAELCVSCIGPDAVYRCEAEGFPQSDTRAQVACITELAKLEGHQSCSVERRSEGPCDGPLKTVQRHLVPELVPGLGPGTSAPPAEAPPPAEDSPPAAKPPTVASELKKAGEAAQEGARSTGEKIGDAGRSVGSAVQKAWNCMTSLMQEC